MASVLTAQSTVSCPHTGTVTTPIASEARLSVGGEPVLPADAILAPINGCTVTAAPPNTLKCLAVALITKGRATKLTVNKVPVLLDTLAGTTTGAPPPPPAGPAVSATAGQTRLRAV